MAITYGSQSTVTGNSLAISIFSSLDPTFLNVEYPERLWKKVIGKQVNGAVAAGAQNHVHMTKDRHGVAGFMSPVRGANIPKVGVSMGAIIVPLAVAAVGADIFDEDARQYEQGNLGSLPQDLQFAMQDASENLIEASFFFGNAAVGFNSWLSYTGITVATAAQSANSGNTRLWTGKTALEILADINAGIAAMYTGSNTLFVADTLYLSPARFLLLQQPMVIGGVAVAMSIMEYILKNNAAVALGKTFKIEPIRYLATAGADSLNRAVFMCHDSKYQEMAFPIPYTLKAPVQIALGATMVAEEKFGSFACYQPGTMLYMDSL